MKLSINLPIAGKLIKLALAPQDHWAKVSTRSLSNVGTVMLLMAVFFAGVVFAQTSGRAKGVKAITIRIDGFMKSKSGAV